MSAILMMHFFRDQPGDCDIPVVAVPAEPMVEAAVELEEMLAALHASDDFDRWHRPHHACLMARDGTRMVVLSIGEGPGERIEAVAAA